MLPARERLQNGLVLNETSSAVFHAGNEKYDAFPSGEIFNYSFDLIFTEKTQHRIPESMYFTSLSLD